MDQWFLESKNLILELAKLILPILGPIFASILGKKSDKITKSCNKGDDNAPPRVSPEVHRKIGDQYLALQKYEQALEAYQVASQLEPDNALYFDKAAQALCELGEYKEALRASIDAVARAPFTARYHYDKGSTLRRMRDYEHAITELSYAVCLEPQNAMYHHQLGVTYHALKRYSDAMCEMENAVQLAPDNDQYKKTLSQERRLAQRVAKQERRERRG